MEKEYKRLNSKCKFYESSDADADSERWKIQIYSQKISLNCNSSLYDIGYIRVGFGMRFFRDPGSRSWKFGIRIFNFGLDQKIPKIPKSRRSESGFENPEKIGIFPNVRIFYLRDIPGIFIPGSGFFPWDGISRQKANSGLYIIYIIHILLFKLWK